MVFVQKINLPKFSIFRKKTKTKRTRIVQKITIQNFRELKMISENSCAKIFGSKIALKNTQENQEGSRSGRDKRH